MDTEFPSINPPSKPLKRYVGVYLREGQVRRISLEATDLSDARAQAAQWGIGVDAEEKDTAPIKAALPEAFGVKDAMRMLGGVSRSTIYNLINTGTLDRLPYTRRVLITRRSIERYASGH